MAGVSPITVRDIFDSCKAVYHFVQKCRETPEIVKAVNMDLHCLEAELQDIETDIKDGSIAHQW